MKVFPGSWNSKLTAGVTNFCTLWRIQRADGVDITLTDHHDDIQWGGFTFKARPGYQRSAIRYESGLKPHTVEVDGAFVADDIAAEDLANGVYDRAIITIWLIDYENVQDGPKVLIKGSMGETTIKDNSYKIEVVAITNAYGTTIMNVYTPLCRADFGDSRCGFSVPTESVGAIGMVGDMAVAVDAGPAGNDRATYADGILSVTGGEHTGARVEIRGWSDGNVISLWTPMPVTLNGGEPLEIRAGCRKTLSACKGWGNVLNFRGEPYIPGVTKVMRFPDAR